VITRRSGLLACGLAVVHPLGHGQAITTLRRVGWLSLASQANTGPAKLYLAFKQGMSDLGWTEGKNVEYRFVYAEDAPDRLDALASELIRQRVEVIGAGNAAATRALQRATKTIPIVMASVSNAAGGGFVASLAQPAGNITGITTQQEEVLGKLIGILHEVAPGARRVAIVLDETNPTHPVYWSAAQNACAGLGLVALRVVANSPSQFGTAVAEIVRQRSHAVVFVADPLYLNNHLRLHELMQPTQLPVAYGWREHVAAGGLLSYGADLIATDRHVATYVDKILKGARPADLPVEQPTKFELVINLKTARALGLTIPQPLLLRADDVIQ
jgi:putative ABC transport system substrate-binding protein